MATYGLLGKKLTHSYSAEYFNSKFQKEGIDSIYKLFEIDNIQQISNILETQPFLRGLNVTIPYKEKIIPFLECIDKNAAKIGAVNTIRIVEGKLYGFNTDIIGFEQLLNPLIKKNIPKALIFGTGGAAKAVGFVLKKKGISFKTVSRSKAKGDLVWEEITPEIIANYQFLINTTPLGMAPQIAAAPPLPYEAVTPNHIAIDLIYNPKATVFLKRCFAQKAVIFNGLHMLYAQAEAAWKIWNLSEKEIIESVSTKPK